MGHFSTIGTIVHILPPIIHLFDSQFPQAILLIQWLSGMLGMQIAQFEGIWQGRVVRDVIYISLQGMSLMGAKSCRLKYPRCAAAFPVFLNFLIQGRRNKLILF